MLSKHKNILLIIFAIPLVGLAFVNKFDAGVFSANTMDTKDKFYIEPSEIDLDIGETYKFTSYVDTSTGTIAVNSKWSVDYGEYLEISKCSSSSKNCEAEAVYGPATVKLTASQNGIQTHATVKISNDVTHESAEDELSEEELEAMVVEKTPFYISPLKVLMYKNSNYTFTSYTETGTIPTETKSDNWSINYESKGEINNCKNKSSTCTFYSDFKTGDVELYATKGSKTATAYIEINDTLVNPFEDSLPDWADDYIISMYNKGIITGYTDTKFGAENTVTRADFITMIYRLAQYAGLDTESMLENKNCNIYSDVLSFDYFYKAICFAKSYGWLGDQFNSSEFKPNDPMIREIASDIMYYVAFRAILEKEIYDIYRKKPGDDYYDYIKGKNDEYYMIWADEDYTDVKFGDKYNLPIGVVSYYDVMKGNDGVFNVSGSINRAEAAKILWKLKWEINNF